ncbi:MAG: DUF563 domain-containing protein [Rhodobacteraceae bacterium]|nr:DUF563 domain-containing protein [Paracoccaceae bacterium]
MAKMMKKEDVMHEKPDTPAIVIADQPLWALGASEMVAEFICAQPERARVLEFGSGGSTKFLLALGAEVVAVEHHEGWADALVHAARVDGFADRLTLLLRGRPYAGVTEEFDKAKPFDILLVDGRERMDCLRKALPFVRRGGLVLLDDCQRTRYWPAFEMLAAEPCTTFTSRARNTAIWRLEGGRMEKGFVPKTITTFGASDSPQPFLQLLPEEFLGENMEMDYVLRRPISINTPVEAELRALGLIARSGSYLAPKVYCLHGVSVKIDQGRKVLSHEGRPYVEGNGGFLAAEGVSPFVGVVRLHGRTLDLTASGAGRYSFFVLDALPKLRLAEAAGFDIREFDTILVNSNATWLKDMLQSVVGPDCPKIAAISARCPSYLLDESVQFNPIRSARFTPAWIHAYLEEAFATKRRLEASETFGPYVYISRERAAGRRIMNHDAMREVLARYGFIEVFAEDYTPVALRQALSEARVVISPHGAGLANILFCPASAKVIELFASHYTPQYLYLARDRGQAYLPIACRDEEGLNVFDRYKSQTENKAAFNRMNIAVDTMALDALLAQVV